MSGRKALIKLFQYNTLHENQLLNSNKNTEKNMTFDFYSQPAALLINSYQPYSGYMVQGTRYILVNCCLMAEGQCIILKNIMLKKNHKRRPDFTYFTLLKTEE